MMKYEVMSYLGDQDLKADQRCKMRDVSVKRRCTRPKRSPAMQDESCQYTGVLLDQRRPAMQDESCQYTGVLLDQKADQR